MCLLMWNNSRLKKTKTAAFLGRTPLTCEEILRDCFPELSIPKDEFGKVWLCLGGALCIDPKYLRPEDQLDDERIITESDEKYEINVTEQVWDLISDNRIILRKLKMPPNPPTTIREIVYLCLGRDDLIES